MSRSQSRAWRRACIIHASDLDDPAAGQHDEARGVLGRLTGLTVRLSPVWSNGRSVRRVHGALSRKELARAIMSTTTLAEVDGSVREWRR
jgi:hypothetical protein